MKLAKSSDLPALILNGLNTRTVKLMHKRSPPQDLTTRTSKSFWTILSNIKSRLIVVNLPFKIIRLTNCELAVTYVGSSFPSKVASHAITANQFQVVIRAKVLFPPCKSNKNTLLVGPRLCQINIQYQVLMVHVKYFNFASYRLVTRISFSGSGATTTSI